VIPPVPLFTALHLHAMERTVAFRLVLRVGLLVPLGLNLFLDARENALDTTEERVVCGVSESQEKLNAIERPFQRAG
jgi:hypothetical protein